ncbi:MAG: hypothetical protein LBI03_05700 [Clostridiales bacterium]|jgi:hypothetical protein|nr:hypothetical protein [Clostridiales bacterium]
MEQLFNEISGISHIKIEETGEKTWTVSSTLLYKHWTITVIKDAVYPETETIWAWKIDDQYLDEKYASGYLIRLIDEKKTGFRIIRHKCGTIPELCGYGIDCSAKRRGYFSMLCSSCPIAERMQAEKDGVRLSYIPGDEK